MLLAKRWSKGCSIITRSKNFDIYFRFETGRSFLNIKLKLICLIMVADFSDAGTLLRYEDALTIFVITGLTATSQQPSW